MAVPYAASLNNSLCVDGARRSARGPRVLQLQRACAGSLATKPSMRESSSCRVRGASSRLRAEVETEMTTLRAKSAGAGNLLCCCLLGVCVSLTVAMAVWWQSSIAPAPVATVAESRPSAKLFDVAQLMEAATAAPTGPWLPRPPLRAVPRRTIAEISGGVKLVRQQRPQNERQRAVAGAFAHAWGAYRRYAWGCNELRPLNRSGKDCEELAWTILDGLGTAFIMGESEAFEDGRRWVADHLDRTWRVDHDLNMFETSIRALGGLLSAHALSGEEVLLTMAQGLGRRLAPAFETPTGLPHSDVNPACGSSHGPPYNRDEGIVAEVGTLSLEWKLLADLSGVPEWRQAVEQIDKVLASSVEESEGRETLEGLVPSFLSTSTGRLRRGKLTVGGRSDSYFEYLLKQWIQAGPQGGALEAECKRRYERAQAAILKHLFAVTPGPGQLAYLKELGPQFPSGGRPPSPQMDHLACYVPGMLALAHHRGIEGGLEPAVALIRTCYQMYASWPTGLAPEITFMRNKGPDGTVNPNVPGEGHADMRVKPADSFSLLRPEALESLFVMYRVTRNETYRDWGWKIFQALETHARVESGGYASIQSVLTLPAVKRTGKLDKLDTWFFAETLKYLYLLFSDDPELVSLDRWVFNTEGHPLPIYGGGWPDEP